MIFCHRCLPGYTPTYDGTKKYVVTSCSLIVNCEDRKNGNIFNGCSKCKKGWIHSTESSKRYIQFNCSRKIDDSKASQNQNCFAGILDGSTEKCSICLKGFSKKNNQCIKKEAANCKSYIEAGYDIIDDTSKIGSMAQYLHYSIYKGVGCQECLLPRTSTVIYQNVALLQDNEATTSALSGLCILDENTPHYIHNCRTMGLKECDQCEEGYGLVLVDTDKIDCIKNTLTFCEKPANNLKHEEVNVTL